MIVEEGDYLVATVGYAEHDERKTNSLKACVGIDPAVFRSLPLTWAETRMGRWAVATAIHTREPSVGRHQSPIRIKTDTMCGVAPWPPWQPQKTLCSPSRPIFTSAIRSYRSVVSP